MKALIVLLTLTLGSAAFAADEAIPYDPAAPTFMDSDEYDPNAANIEEVLQQYDRYYEMETGLSPHLEGFQENDLFTPIGGCYRSSCAVWAHVNKSTQRLNL